jgi:hypothetical protein
MELLNEVPAGYDGVAKAFEMAKHLPSSHRANLQVGLVHNGSLFARGTLDGYRQVSFFSEHLRDLGWHEHLLGGEQDMFGCDMLFSHPGGDAAPADADPSFIRRPPVELWPARNSHAET